PEWVAHLAHRIAVRAFDYAERTPCEQRALERARAEHPGRATELRRLERVQRDMRRVDRGAA
ncbi:MAG: hypothetical protein Q8M17_16205, partial [Actinomycetota bacterium]|nr:hypothetical protein [Actinomycetota bacterium]